MHPDSSKSSLATTEDVSRDDISPPPPTKRRRRSSQDGRADATPDAVKHKQLPHKASSCQPPLPPDPQWLCVYSWNINGIAAFLQPSLDAFLKPGTAAHPLHKSNSTAPITTSLRNFLRRHHWPQILHLQEVKINPADEATQRSVQRAVNVCRSGPDSGPSYTVKFCLPRDRFNATGFGRKVYGVATVIRDDFYEQEVTAVREVDWDIEGRVLVVETRSKLALFNIYAVNGTTNAYRDPETGTVAGSRHDRKLAFHRHLLDECKQLESTGWRVVLAGDFNVAPAHIDGFPHLRTQPPQHVKNRADFNRKFLLQRDGGDGAAAVEANVGEASAVAAAAVADQARLADDRDGLGAVDSFRHLHPDRKLYTYLPRNTDWQTSCDRVDLILLSRSLVQEDQGTLKEADILMSEAERGPSDHVPLFVWLDLDSDKGLFEE